MPIFSKPRLRLRRFRGRRQPTKSYRSKGDSEAANAPKAGEIRYYKKKYSRPTHDVMVRVGDCGCNKWQGGHSADKARKGIARMEGGRSDWRGLYHCGSCTGEACGWCAGRLVTGEDRTDAILLPMRRTD